MIVYGDGNTRSTWVNVPVSWRKNGKISLRVTVRFHVTNLWSQHGHLSSSVADIVGEAALDVKIDDGLRFMERIRTK
jgi:hypothetical protein